MRVRRHRRLRKVLARGFLVLLALLAGALTFAYVNLTDGDNITRLVKKVLPRYLPGATVDVGKAQVRLMKGEIHLPRVVVRQVIDGVPFLTAKIPWLNVRSNP